MVDSPVALTLIGIAVIAVTVGLLLRGKVNPVVAMSLVPVIGALLAGFGPAEISEFFGAGLERVMNVVGMFIFAIIFFGIMQDAGLFTPIISRLIRGTRGKVVLVTLGTAAIAVFAHLDGAGASTFLITIPALLPLYEALKMSKYTLLTIVAMSASVMNMLPWAGPVGRAASVIKASPDGIWRHLLPMQLVAVVLVFILAAALGVMEARRLRQPAVVGGGQGSGVGGGGGVAKHGNVDVHLIADEFERHEQERRAKDGITKTPTAGRLAFNAVLTVAVIASLVSGVMDPAPTFLLATAIALVFNARTVEDQAETLKRHAPAALSMASVIIAAAMFLGVLDGAGMLEAIAVTLINVLPPSVGPYIHLIVGLFGVPLDLLTSTDAYCFSVLPIVEQTGANFGVSPLGAATSMVIGNVIGTFVSPFSPALWLGVGLAGANMGQHIKRTFLIAWVFSMVMVLIAWVLGLLA